MDDNNQTSEPINYEETPVIDEPISDKPVSDPVISTPESPQAEPVPEIAPPPEEKELPPAPVEEVPPQASQPKKQSSFMATLVNIILFGILFAFGVGASVFIRQYLASRPKKEPATTTAVLLTPTPTVTVSEDILANWKTYQVINGNTKLPINGISFLLPPDVIAPICDGPACVSQGTYLPGGSRFTVAARGVGQVLPTTAGAIMTDAGGRNFIMKEASISGLPSQEFTGLFAGTTGGGYTFSQIRGVVIHGPVGISLEVSHFTPTGVNANWDTDDTLFDKIIESVSFGFLPTPTSVITPQASPTANPQQ